MEIARSGSFVTVRLDHGENVLESIGKLVKDEKCTMMVTSGLGMMVDFQLGFFDRGSYLKNTYAQPHELLSLQGSISSEGENRIHVHAAVANMKHEAFGGHLLGGKVWMSNEISLLRFEGVRSERTMDPERKVGVLHFIR